MDESGRFDCPFDSLDPERMEANLTEAWRNLFKASEDAFISTEFTH
jgi:hypothetical protein